MTCFWPLEQEKPVGCLILVTTEHDDQAGLLSRRALLLLPGVVGHAGPLVPFGRGEAQPATLRRVSGNVLLSSFNYLAADK